jgi:chemotaxis protein MotB
MAMIVFALGCGSKSSDASKPPDDQVKALQDELKNTKDALAKATAATEELKKSEGELKAKADEADQLQQKLSAAVGQNGEVTTADGAVKLELIDQILFPTGEATLTTNGKAVLAKVGAALKEIGDKQIWVQGHTDDQPIFVKKPKPEPPPPPAKGAKPPPKGTKTTAKVEPKKPPEPEKNDAVLPFVTNWELSAARALTVVHYLQDDAKIDPTRLAAVAFGQYRPVSKTKAKNRRIEIVLYPRAKLTPK